MSDFIVGLTGGVASGKSTVERAFQALGVFVADADVAAREALAVGSDGLAQPRHRIGRARGLGADVRYHVDQFHAWPCGSC